MMRSGMETIFRAVLYSGFFSKRELCSRVETSSGHCCQRWMVGVFYGDGGVVEVSDGEIGTVPL